MLEGLNISKKIGDKIIISEVNITIEPGKVVALIGPSGGGKSTLIRNLSMLERPDSGCVIFDTHKFIFPFNGKILTKDIYPHLTVVFQQFHLFPHLTVRQNLMLPLKYINFGMENQEINELMEYFEIEQLTERFPHQLSVGQKQRVAFVRAVILKPRYLLLDEITSALDIQHISKILKYIKILSAQGTGVLIATHLIGFAANASNKIVFINEGKIVEQGDISILKHPKTELLTKFLTFLDYAA